MCSFFLGGGRVGCSLVYNKRVSFHRASFFFGCFFKENHFWESLWSDDMIIGMRSWLCGETPGLMISNIVIQKVHKGNVLMIIENKHRIPGFLWLEMLIRKVEKNWGSYNLIVMVVSWCGDRKKSDGVEESKSHLLYFWTLLRDMRFWLTGNSFDSCGSSSGGRKGWNLSLWFSKNPRIL